MNLRQIAEADLSFTLEDAGGFACSFDFIDPFGNAFRVKGNVGDIGYMFDTEGVPVAGRTICAVWRMKSLCKNGEYILPGRGWKVLYCDLLGKGWELYVSRCEPDRSLGICRVWLSLDLKK